MELVSLVLDTENENKSCIEEIADVETRQESGDFDPSSRDSSCGDEKEVGASAELSKETKERVVLLKQICVETHQV